MITTISTPHHDVNDDTFTVVDVLVSEGELVAADTELLFLETVKAAIAITPEREGFVRRVLVEEGDEVEVGSPLVIIADSMEESLDEEMEVPAENMPVESSGASLKAMLLARENKIDIADVASSGGRVTEEDVRAHLETAVSICQPKFSGHIKEMSRVARGVMATVTASSKEIVPAYLERYVDFIGLNEEGERVKVERKMLLAPTFSLLCWKFIQLVKRVEVLNGAIVKKQLYINDEINFGFAVDVEGELYFPVLRGVRDMAMGDFLDAMFDLQRKAMKKKLTLEESSGATIGATSLGTYGVTKHIPIVFPGTSVMLAHCAPLPFSPEGTQYATLGVAYDHRVHNGGQIGKMLAALARSLES